MTRRAKRNAILFLLVAVIGVGAVLAGQAVRASVWPVTAPSPEALLDELCTVLAEYRESAYLEMTDGDPTLLDDALADEAAATFHLAVFGMKDLLDDAAREQFMANVLDPEAHPTDALVRLYYEVSAAPTGEETLVLIDELWALADSMNPVARAGALAMLASPWCFRNWPHRPKARKRAQGPRRKPCRRPGRIGPGDARRHPGHLHDDRVLHGRERQGDRRTLGR